MQANLNTYINKKKKLSFAFLENYPSFDEIIITIEFKVSLMI
jgi:hypothetical protein